MIWVYNKMEVINSYIVQSEQSDSTCW
jgi:hypothetical protein